MTGRMAFCVDLADADDAERATVEAVASLGGVDVLDNSAGIFSEAAYAATKAAVAAVALFLSLPESAYLTGQAINISGGMVTH